MNNCKNCKMTDEYCASGDCPNDTLTEQWKKGELPSGMYYIEFTDGMIVQDHYVFGTWATINEHFLKKILAPVPSYYEWEEKLKSLKVLAEAYCKEKEQNKQLKELLKECDNMNTRLQNALWYWNEDSDLYKECDELEEKIREVVR